MNDEKKNKIDSAVDEVLESKRLKQTVSGVSRLIVNLSNIGMVITPIATTLYILDTNSQSEKGVYLFAGALWFFGFLITRFIFTKK